MSRGKIAAIGGLLGLGALAAISGYVYLHRRPVTLRGAVLRQDRDPNRQVPLANVQIAAINNLGTSSATSDSSGYFTLTLPKGLRRRQPLKLQFRRKDYQPLDMSDFVSDKIYLAHMVPVAQEPQIETSHPAVGVSNARVRYSVSATTEADIGSAVKAFQVKNVVNLPCNKKPPCSPDNKWKAAIDSMFLDAGEGNQFTNPRVSCIAGPCPFSKIEREELSQDRRRFTVTVRNWSDTTTFLLEAEVVHPMVSNLVRESYPVIFGRTLNFSLPPAAEGPSIQAEIDGEAIVFPLGPSLFLRWADCHAATERDLSKTYRCELKPGYQFR